MSTQSGSTRRATRVALLVLAITLAAAPAAAQEPSPGTADLVLDKTVTDDPVQEGDLVSFSLNLTNEGPDTATGVVIVDEAPAGFTFAGGAPSCAEGDAPNVAVCDVEDLPANATVGLLVSFRATSSGTFTNHAQASADQLDPNPDDNADSEETRVLGPEDQPPGVPENFTCVAEGTSVHLRWTPVDGVAGPDGGYHVDRREAGEPEFTRITTTNASRSSHVDEDVTPGTAYDYRLTAFDAGGTSPAATCTVTAIPFFPGATGILVGALAAVGAVVAAGRRGRGSR